MLINDNIYVDMYIVYIIHISINTFTDVCISFDLEQASEQASKRT